jgi:small subunit ribosomal protein S4
MEESTFSSVPSHIELDKDKLAGKINSVISREEVGIEINELFIVEFYSRK